MNDPVPAITEANATGEIAEIFGDIRGVLRVDVVNLIWRHLATIPGALPRAWGSLRPLYVDGTIGAEAAALRGDLDFPRLPPFPRELLAAAGLLDDDIRTIGNILAAYDRTNAMALVALSALLLRLEDKPLRLASSSRGAITARKPLPLIPLPPLLNLADMPPATAELVLTLNRLGTRRDNPILASMYRHLAHWPTYLSLTWAFIAPLDADGSLARSVDDAIAKAQTRAARHVIQLHAQSAMTIAPSDRAAIRLAIEPFVGDVIAKMVVICGTCAPRVETCDMVSESGARAAVQIAFSFLVFTDIRLVPIEGWLATAIGRVRLSRSAAFSLRWHRASTHSLLADRPSMPRR